MKGCGAYIILMAGAIMQLAVSSCVKMEELDIRDSDAIVFTAGVLENGAETRESIIEGLAPLGIKINKEVNDAIASFKEITSGIITAEDSTVPVYVEPTNEEVMIIRDAYKLCR